jgi:hypothetical protein
MLMSSPIIPIASFADGTILKRIQDLPPDQQRELSVRTCQRGNELLSAQANQLAQLAERTVKLSDEEALVVLSKGITEVHVGLVGYDEELRTILGIEEPDPDLCAKRLDQYRLALARTEQELHSAEDKNRELSATIADYQGTIANNRARIDGLQAQTNALEAQLKELEHRTTVEPAGLGAALGQAVDAIQQALTSLDNPHIDYGLQEFDLQTYVNLQLDDKGQLLIRFPGVNENIAAQNLSNLQMRLRPIPKTQQAST